MGAALWITSALSVFAFARIVPPGRTRNYLIELIVAVFAALALGVIATALDFGGWRDPDWRAAAFVLLGTAAATGAARAVRLARD
ncbi:MAG TPA: hypothetical protein VL284_14150 [Thermoanaerobaculia bacterium]|nr:hypothetical protein [Thermoanaerobaculia bacterium]